MCLSCLLFAKNGSYALEFYVVVTIIEYYKLMHILGLTKFLILKRLFLSFTKVVPGKRNVGLNRMLDKGHASRQKNYVKFNYLNIFVYTVSCICKLFELLSTLRFLEKIVYFWSEHSIPLKELSTIINYLNY